MIKVLILIFFTISPLLARPVLIDVRERNEVELGMVKGALWFPLSDIESDTDWSKKFTKKTWGKKIYLYCQSGKRAEKVKEILANKAIFSTNLGGYDKVKNWWK